jgi:phosphatidylglycerophosphate synthase
LAPGFFEAKQVLHHKRRAGYEQGSLPYGRICVKLGLTPNMLTVISFGMGVAAGVLFWQRYWLWAVIAMLLSAFTDMLDGATARASGTGTRFGSVLDRFSDRFGEFFILLGILLSGVVAPGWVLFAQFSILMASYTRSAAESVGGLKTCAVGLAGRLEKFIMIIAGAAGEMFLPGYSIMQYAIIVVGLVSAITAVQRLVFTYRMAGREERP